MIAFDLTLTADFNIYIQREAGFDSPGKILPLQSVKDVGKGLIPAPAEFIFDILPVAFATELYECFRLFHVSVSVDGLGAYVAKLLFCDMGINELSVMRLNDSRNKSPVTDFCRSMRLSCVSSGKTGTSIW